MVKKDNVFKQKNNLFSNFKFSKIEILFHFLTVLFPFLNSNTSITEHLSKSIKILL
jgi:hypothetical protein